MISDGPFRRNSLIEYLQGKAEPVSGTELSKLFGVSRQVIVQDVALLRAENYNILSTNKGYMLYQSRNFHKGKAAVIKVRHTAEQTLDEMRSIVDYGAGMLDVFVDHDLYGQIRVDLVINTLQDAEEFCEKMMQSTSKPLKVLTEDYHYHTIHAPSEKALDLILKELDEKGFLIQN